MTDPTPLFVAFSMGILGAAHCIGMCGGIMGALTVAIASDNYRRRLLVLSGYNLGRIISYGVIAWLFYQFINSLEHYLSLRIMRYIAGTLLIAMGLYLANWWRGLVYLEKLGGYVWRVIQPLGRSLLPVKSLSQAFFLGAVWGWLPCGLIYSVLAYSATAADSVQAVFIMLSFGLGTLPTVMAGGLLAERLTSWIKKSMIRQGFGVLIILLGAWTLVGWKSHI